MPRANVRMRPYKTFVGAKGTGIKVGGAKEDGAQRATDLNSPRMEINSANYLKEGNPFSYFDI